MAKFTLARSLALSVAAAGLVGMAQAAPVTCDATGPGTGTGPRAVTIDDAQSCALVGIGSLTNADLIAALGTATTSLDRDVRPTLFGLPAPTFSNTTGALSVNFNTVTSTNWSVSPSLWGSYQNLWLYIDLYPSTPGVPGALTNPDYFVFQLTRGDTSGTFGGGLLPFNIGPAALQTVALVGQVPEPGTLALAGLALAGLGLGLRRRKHRV